MGVYLNPGDQNFADTLKREIYVDKTMMLNVLNGYIEKDNRYVCVSRPRRFGKTIAQNMIAAYYSRGADSSELFKHLKIAQIPGYETYMNRFNCIQIDLNAEYSQAEAMGQTEDVLNRLLRKIEREFRAEFAGIVTFEDDDNLIDMIQAVYQQGQGTFVILIDEYDVLVREQISERLMAQYRNLLNSLFKSNTLKPAISLAYITGILPIVRDRVQSKLNNFKEYTIIDARELAEYVGFTSDEVKYLCEKYDVDYAECKRWYDGYSQHGYEIYNPESVIEAIETGYFSNYWGRTSSFAVVSDRLNADFDGMRTDVVRMMAGESVPVDVDHYENTMDNFQGKDDAFTYLIHTGYLAYDLRDGTCRIPNNEIRKEWRRALESDSNYSAYWDKL